MLVDINSPAGDMEVEGVIGKFEVHGVNRAGERMLTF